MLSLDAAYLAPNVTPELVAQQTERLALAHATLTKGTGAGSDFLGWLDPAAMADDALLDEIESIATDLRARTDVLVSVGIGGSYLGARAVLEALSDSVDRPVLFAGQNLSARYHTELLKSIAGKKVAVNAISKSGTTTEPAVAFRILRELAEPGCIVATTDKNKGALRKVAGGAGWRTLPIEDSIGGRYSVLSPVGLLPLAYAGIDIRELQRGAIACARASAEPDPKKNPVLFYAAARNLLYQQGFLIEALASFEPRLHYVLEWWKQLFGESEGKNHIALYPSSVEFTTDLHSMGQYFQEGRRALIETFLIIEDGEPSLTLPTGDNADELGYLVGQELTAINHAAYEATALAHREGGVPSLTIRLPKLDAYHLGFLLYFFECACGVSGYLLGVNPFDQPGVEAYKLNMFGLLGKPGAKISQEELKAKVSAAGDEAIVRF
ncbi:glucose-6-phosphate isomerase [Armatimonas sp.]|uniref:glucose-6-phosphate isomerase n=1 Tax=Armatimonas sp. TaxID=1872638 RepID=UPI00374CBACD